MHHPRLPVRYTRVDSRLYGYLNIKVLKKYLYHKIAYITIRLPGGVKSPDNRPVRRAGGLPCNPQVVFFLKISGMKTCLSIDGTAVSGWRTG